LLEVRGLFVVLHKLVPIPGLNGLIEDAAAIVSFNDMGPQDCEWPATDWE